MQQPRATRFRRQHAIETAAAEPLKCTVLQVARKVKDCLQCGPLPSRGVEDAFELGAPADIGAVKADARPASLDRVDARKLRGCGRRSPDQHDMSTTLL